MARSVFSSIEPLESRIAPAAVAALHPLADMVVGLGKTSSVIDLGNLYDTTDAPGYHPVVEFTTNFDTDLTKPGLQAGVIDIELREDVAPLTVQNFLNYVTNLSKTGDYNGVFFHRAVNTMDTPTSGNNLQILQAGGFDVANPSAHIAIGPTVHNEYSLPNVAQTIAMAKVGGDPNSASSEFFFNMGDNSTTLGPANNGGFTVFGAVTQGYDVLQKILAAPLIDESVATKNGALATVPYQGVYDSNPDQNLATPAPALKTANYIEIVSAKIIPAADAVSPNVRFDIVSTLSHGTTAKSTLVTPKLVGDKLTLVYNTAQSGVADVTIRATNATTHEVLGDDTFSVTLKPNLIIGGVADSFQTVIGPGDLAQGKVLLVNNGGAALKGAYTVNFYLSAINTTDTAGTTLDASDTLLSSVVSNLNIASGKSSTVTENLAIPTDLIKTQTNYRILASVVATDPAAVNELYTDDQTPGVSTSGHTLTNAFGLLVSNGTTVRNHPSITYKDVSGHVVTATITGPGLGQLTPSYVPNSDNTGSVLANIDLDFFDTTAATTVTFAVAGGTTHTTLETVRVNFDAALNPDAIGTLNLGKVDLSGSFIAPGGLKSLTLGDVLRTTFTNPNSPSTPQIGEHLLSFGSSPAFAKVQPVLKLGALDNTVINSSLIVGSLSVASWKNDTFQDISTLPGVKTLLVTGDLQTNLEINAEYGDATFVNTDPAATIATTTFKVGGTALKSSVKIAGNVGTVDLGAIDASQILVGADSVVSDVSQFNNLRTIASFIVRGITGKDFSMSDSDIVAANITNIKVSGALNTAAGNDQWGFIADKIGTYARAAIGTGATGWAAKSGKNLTMGDFDTKGNYDVELL